MRLAGSWRVNLRVERQTSLVLIAHGSSKNANARQPLCRVQRALEAGGEYAEVVYALLKEEPGLDRLQERLVSRETVVVPYFMAEGYYSREVIPRALSLEGRVVRYAPPVGTHPLISEILVELAKAAGGGEGDALVILAHGTSRNIDSARCAREHAQRIRELKRFAEVRALFLDQEPHISKMFERCSTERIVVVPLFAADGWHVSETIPEELGLEGPHTRRDGRTLIYTAAVGESPRMIEVVRACAAQAE